MYSGCSHELEYLKELNQKYSHYLGKYFSFTLKEIAAKIGINDKLFLMVLKGYRQMPKKHIDKFAQVFKDMDIETRTKDFKESESQKSIRALSQKIRLDNRAFLWIIIVTMANLAIFLKPTNVTCLYYIVGKWVNLAQFSYKATYKAITFLVVAFFVFLKKFTQILQKFCSLNYEWAFSF